MIAGYIVGRIENLKYTARNSIVKYRAKYVQTFLGVNLYSGKPECYFSYLTKKQKELRLN